jgi:excisionase family DNA binding protein
MERLLKVPEVAARTALSRTTIYELIARGDLPSVALGGTRTRRVREADLDAWIRRQAEAQSSVVA